MSDEKRMELFRWFEEHCLWARRVDPNDEDKFSSTGEWQVYVSTGVHKSVIFGGATFLGAIEMAKGICES
jgi:hypothetical protein